MASASDPSVVLELVPPMGQVVVGSLSRAYVELYVMRVVRKYTIDTVTRILYDPDRVTVGCTS